jgi:periplasmic divalent cation tolerance protein
MAKLNAVVVLTTVPDEVTGDALARMLVEERLAACVQRMPIASTYRWQGRVEEGGEILLLIKTTSDRVPAVEARITQGSSYDTPEIVVLAATATAPAYLAWLEASCTDDVDL